MSKHFRQVVYEKRKGQGGRGVWLASAFLSSGELVWGRRHLGRVKPAPALKERTNFLRRQAHISALESGSWSEPESEGVSTLVVGWEYYHRLCVVMHLPVCLSVQSLRSDDHGLRSQGLPLHYLEFALGLYLSSWWCQSSRSSVVPSSLSLLSLSFRSR